MSLTIVDYIKDDLLSETFLSYKRSVLRLASIIRMSAKLILLYCIVLQVAYTDVNQKSAVGIEAAVLMDGELPTGRTQSLTGSLRTYFEPLQFRLTSPSYVPHWWCVKMFEVTKSWDDNYLCANRNIGLHWIWDRRAWRTDLKCVATAEPSDNNWNDNSLCLPSDSNIELVWSYGGPVNRMACLQLYDPAAPSYMNDNYLCWKEHKPF